MAGVIEDLNYWSRVNRLATNTTGDYITITSPYGDKLYSLALSSESDISTAIHTAKAAQVAWGSQGLRNRARVILRFHDLVLAHKDELLDLIQWETGKPRRDANEELLDVMLNARYYARHVGALKDRKHSGVFPLLISAIERHVPVGVVGIIAPWNYPLTLAVSDAIPALLAGNAVVLKPDPLTSATALYVIDLLYRAGLPEGLFGVVIGDGEKLGAPLINQVNFLMFTGSTKVGRVVAAQCGEQLIGAALELGGKNAMIIRADSDIERAAEIATRACFGNTGQLCISIERLYVHESIEQAFLESFVRITRAMTYQDSVGWGGSFGPLISPVHAARVMAFISDAREKGAKIHTGGELAGNATIAPTIMTGVTEQMNVCRDETFGPVVAVSAFSSDSEAIGLANDSEYGLNASVISKNRKVALAIARELHAGTVNINEGYATAWSTLGSPMGGFGASGLGRRHAVAGILQYTQSQTIATQNALGFGPPFGLNDEKWGNLLTASLGVMKKIGWR
ncbi:MAG: succinic semialdehyde dehydrogenase [Candidatus Nanopelagicales bacterium]|jgi:succinate-semialdehyde dehydrogenase/glutarate-semialdehyde dehydrogenase|nr:succinic semialdehyde dehydrogenase [Candidatus Nanopelagicales bacterium]